MRKTKAERKEEAYINKLKEYYNGYAWLSHRIRKMKKEINILQEKLCFFEKKRNEVKENRNIYQRKMYALRKWESVRK